VIYEGWFDGCCEPRNPGGHAAWGAILFRGRDKLWESGGYCGVGPKMSNNVAEYSGVLALLKEVIKHNSLHEPVILRGDSKLVVYQLIGEWRVRGGLYIPYYREAAALAKQLRKITKNRLDFRWVPRDENAICDVLSKAQLKDRGVVFRIQPEA
jgi:ribonuclease HI